MAVRACRVAACRVAACQDAAAQTWPMSRCARLKLWGPAACAVAGAAGSTVLWCSEPRFQFDAKPEGFSPLYVSSPQRRTAATNAGDYRLYLGGGSINLAFLSVLKDAGLESRGKKNHAYADLHKALLRTSKVCAGALVSASDIPDAADLLNELGLIASFGRQGDDLEDLHGLEGSTGSVFIDVFSESRRPMGSKGNIAMLYVVGPKGQKCKFRSAEDNESLYLEKAPFLNFVERMAKRALETVNEYNQRCEESRLPSIEEVRWCLVSGGVYMHGDCTPLDVAEATLRGMQAVKDDGVVVTFAYADDVFRKAARSSRL